MSVAAEVNYVELEMLAKELGLDLARMEATADKIVALATENGVTRKEMASVCAAIAVNHMVATGVERARASMVVTGMYDYRLITGISEKVLVPGQ